MSHPFKCPFMWTLTAAISALLLVSTGLAAAQSADAEHLFNEARRFEAEGKLAEACDAYEASNRIEPRAGTLIRLGQCREKQGRTASAWAAYKDALARVKDPAKKKFAEDRVSAVESSLSYLTVSVPDAARVDGLTITRNGTALDPALWNQPMPTDPGTYTIIGSAPGYEPWQVVSDVSGATNKLVIELPRLKPIVPQTAPSPSVESEVTQQPTVAALPHSGEPAPSLHTGTPSMFSRKRKVALGLAGAGLASLVGGIVLGARSNGLKRDAFALCPDPAALCADFMRAQDLAERGGRQALYADVAFGAGAAIAVGATISWLMGAPTRPDRMAVTPKIGSGVAGAALRVQF